MAKRAVKKDKRDVVVDTTYDVIIGIDQSYDCTGIAVISDLSTGFPRVEDTAKLYLKNECDTPAEARYMLRSALECMISSLAEENTFQGTKGICVIYERVRLFTAGHIAEEYIKNMSMMVGMIEDLCWQLDIDCYSVDTRAWKSKVVGTTKPLENDKFVDPKKYPTIKYVEEELGIVEDIRDILPDDTRKRNYLVDNGIKYVYNDNVADAICIGLYGYIKKRKLRKEELQWI